MDRGFDSWRDWFARHPSKVAVTLSSRAALRFLPESAASSRISPFGALRAFRATSIAWTVAKFPEYGKTLIDFAQAATLNNTGQTFRGDNLSLAESVASYCAHAAAATYQQQPTRVAYAASLAIRMDYQKVDEAYNDAVDLDEHEIQRGIPAADLASKPLWLEPAPSRITELWQDLASRLLESDENWAVWIDWYEDRLAGIVGNRDIHLSRARLPTRIWEGGPGPTNRKIAEIIARGNRETERGGLSYDFYISYSAQDDIFTRWLENLLSLAGYRTFPPFDEIEAGVEASNLFREINSPTRIICMLSPSYFRSESCQAELRHFLSSKPEGETCAFLVRPTDLPPSIAQLGFRPLVGLSPFDAAKTVLDFLGYVGELPDIPSGWPADAAIEQMRAAAGGIFDVAPNKEFLLERKPSTRTATSQGFTSDELFKDMRDGIVDFAKHTRRERGNYNFSGRLKNRARDLEQEAVKGLFGCDPLALNKTLVWTLRIIALDQADGTIPSNDEIDHFISDLYGYYNRLEQFFPELRAYRKMDARNRFQAPSKNVEDAIRFVYGSFGNPQISSGALSAELSEDLKRAGQGIEETKKLAEKKPSETLDIAVETHADAAVRSLAVWSWLTNARQRLESGGQSAQTLASTLEKYEKLYSKTVPQMTTYIGYLLKWFF